MPDTHIPARHHDAAVQFWGTDRPDRTLDVAQDIDRKRVEMLAWQTLHTTLAAIEPLNHDHLYDGAEHSLAIAQEHMQRCEAELEELEAR